VKVIKGRVLDFVVDLRPDSPDYMTLNTFMLTPDNQIFVPRNFAHGFLTLEDDCVVQYLVDNEYSKESERTLFWNELPELREILQNTNLIISDKDNPLFQ
jgi:dTDP-4-dehydrorhamnose 3,5-epimerase